MVKLASFSIVSTKYIAGPTFKISFNFISLVVLAFDVIHKDLVDLCSSEVYVSTKHERIHL